MSSNVSYIPFVGEDMNKCKEEMRKLFLSIGARGKRSGKYIRCPSSMTLDGTHCMSMSGPTCMGDVQRKSGLLETF